MKRSFIAAVIAVAVCKCLAVCAVSIAMSISFVFVTVIIALDLIFIAAVAAFLLLKEKRRNSKSFVLWFTGLSGSGKSTLAQIVYDRIISQGILVEKIDGDVVRDIFPSTGFSRADRDSHVKRIGFVAAMLEKNGVIVIASLISPYREARNTVRRMCRCYIEVFVAAPLSECERRDVKGLYAKARSGEIANFTGISDPYEESDNPELRIDTSAESKTESAERIIDYLKNNGLLA